MLDTTEFKASYSYARQITLHARPANAHLVAEGVDRVDELLDPATGTGTSTSRLPLLAVAAATRGHCARIRHGHL